jgi:hypothetical protein
VPDEVPQRPQVIEHPLGKGEGLADESGAPLTQGAEEPLDVVGQAVPLLAGGMTLDRDDGPVGGQEVGADGLPRCGRLPVMPPTGSGPWPPNGRR